MKKLFLLGSLVALAVTAHAESVKMTGTTGPHFYLVMENQSDKDASISFKKEVGDIYLAPTLADNTPLAAHQQSLKYGVYVEPIDPKNTFSVVFTGKKDCTFTLGFFGPGNPKVSVSGYGCAGGGYKIVESGHTLLLYISDIHLKS